MSQIFGHWDSKFLDSNKTGLLGIALNSARTSTETFPFRMRCRLHVSSVAMTHLV